MQTSEGLFRLAPGLEIISVADASYVLRSDFVALELSGEAAVALVERVLRELEPPCTLAEITARLPDYKPDGVKAQVEKLIEAGVLVTVQDPASPPHSGFAAFLEQAGIGAARAAECLAAARVAIFGLEAHGAHLALLLAKAGVGTLVLVDPDPFTDAHLELTPTTNVTLVGRSREDVVAHALAGLAHPPRTPCAGAAPLTRERTAEQVAGASLVVGCFDQGLAAAHHWLNHSALAAGIPALYSSLRAAASFAGPLVLPGQSPCWMCYRMRSIAAEDDFASAMAEEEHLDRKRAAGLAARPLLPHLPAQLAAVLGLEVLRVLLDLGPPTLAGVVSEHDALANRYETHTILFRSDCPVCAKKKRAGSLTSMPS